MQRTDKTEDANVVGSNTFKGVYMKTDLRNIHTVKSGVCRDQRN